MLRCPLAISSRRNSAAIPPLRNGRRRRCSGRDDRTRGRATRRRGREDRSAAVPSATLKAGGMTQQEKSGPHALQKTQRVRHPAIYESSTHYIIVDKR